MEKRISVNWNDEKSMKRANRLKTKLENSGFNLLKTLKTGIDTNILIYSKCNHKLQNKLNTDIHEENGVIYCTICGEAI